MKKKLIFIANSLEIGGIENALINLLNKINYSKYDVTLVLEKKEGVLLSKLNSNVHVERFRVSNFKIVPLRKMYNFIHRLLWSIKNKNKYDFSCCYATYSYMASALSLIASKNSAMYVHSDYSNIYSVEDFIKFFISRKIDRFKHIIFVSNESRIIFEKIFNELEDRCITINNFIDDESILKKAEEPIEIKKEKDILFTFVGRLDESSKKITKLLYLIKNLHFNVELWIVGDGPDRKMYEDYIKENNLNNVHMLGMKENPYPYIKAADYIIMTSVYEGFPVIYQEAILLNKKIITTINVTDSIITIDGNFGYIISQDKDQMVEDVSRILENDTMRCLNIDFGELNNEKMEELEKIFDEVV